MATFGNVKTLWTIGDNVYCTYNSFVKIIHFNQPTCEGVKAPHTVALFFLFGSIVVFNYYGVID